MDWRAACVAVVVFGLTGPDPVLAGGPALLAEPTVSAPVRSAAVDWTGPYAGLSFGAAWSDGEAEIEDAFGTLIERDVGLGLFPGAIDDGAWSAFGSANLGYNVQRGRFVGGVEVELGAVGEANELDFSRIDPGGEGFEVFEGVDTRTSYGTDVDALGSLRLRGGIAEGRNLFFATAGVAAGRVENGFALDVPQFPAIPGFPDGPISEDWSESGVRHGYILGAGVERRLTENLSIKGELLYYDLDDVTIEARLPGVPDEGIDYEFDNDGYIVRIGINYAF